VWKQIRVYTVRYRSRGGIEILVKTLHRPKKERIFRTAQNPGRVKFKAVAATTELKEVILVAKTKKGSSKKKGKPKEEELTEEELSELEELDDLEDLDEEESDDDESEDEDEDEPDEEEEDEDEDEDEDEEEDDEEEEDAKPKKKSKPKKKKSRDDGKVGTAELADELGVSARDLRIVLRKEEIGKDAESGRYEWDPDSKTVAKIRKLVKGGAVKEARDESLQKLKDRREEKTKVKEGGKSSKKKKGSKKGSKKSSK
jgi:hypothetical protein